LGTGQNPFGSGINLREIARSVGLSGGTLLARASREKWTPRIEAAKSLANPLETAMVPACDAVALTMQARAKRHMERMAGITDRVLPQLESMQPAEILGSAQPGTIRLRRAAQSRTRESTASGWDDQPCDPDQSGCHSDREKSGLARRIAADGSCSRLKSKAAKLQSGHHNLRRVLVKIGQEVAKRILRREP